MPSDFDGFSTEIRLALLTLKEDIRTEVKEAATGVLTEVRERLQRNEEERNTFYRETKEDIKEIKEIGKETRELAKKTNGRVDRHQEILLGVSGSGEDGALSKIAKNSKFIAWLIAAGGAWMGALAILWMVWGPEVQSRGILNRPATDYVEFVDARIKQWMPGVEKPMASPPNLTPNKNGVATPNN